MDPSYDIIVNHEGTIQTEPIYRETFSGEKRYIRIWKLGSLEHRIFVKKEAFDKLHNILKDWDGQSNLDLVWDDTLRVEVITLGEIND
jgi:hypothetical protein